MRTIKFRAWDNRFKTMVIDPLVSTYDAKVNDEFYFAESGQTGLIFMQYTGLKDKNGKEIYEGDFLHLYNHDSGVHSEGVVIFENGCFILKDKNGVWEYIHESYVTGIIGNIYEHPELLGSAGK